MPKTFKDLPEFVPGRCRGEFAVMVILFFTGVSLLVLGIRNLIRR